MYLVSNEGNNSGQQKNKKKRQKFYTATIIWDKVNSETEINICINNFNTE